MRFRCPKCKTIFKRDMRLKMYRLMLTKRGYRSDCLKVLDSPTYCKPVQGRGSDGKR